MAPTHYAQVAATRGASTVVEPRAVDPHLGDYESFYSGALFGGAPPDAHDAFVSWAGLRTQFVDEVLPRLASATRSSPRSSPRRVLEVGVGLSDVGPGLADLDGVLYCGCDAVADCVALQRARHPRLALAVGDARRLSALDGFLASTFGSRHVDVVFDKGTFDALSGSATARRRSGHRDRWRSTHAGTASTPQ